MSETVLGKITHVSFGFGGYQDCQFGLSLIFESESTGVSTKICGGWGYGRVDPGEHTKWREEDRTKTMAEMCKRIADTLRDAKVDKVADLLGKPVEMVFYNNTLQSWRILKEVL